MLNIISTSPFEPHTLRACLFKKECANNQYTRCSCVPEHTANLTKILAVRCSDQKTLKPVVLWFFQNLSRSTLRLCYEIQSFIKNAFLWKITKTVFVGSFIINEFFESRQVTAKSFFSVLSLLTIWFISVYKVKIFFSKHLHIVLEIEGSNISTLSPTTSLGNIQFTSVCSYT